MVDESNSYQPDFTLVRTFTPAEALALLVKRFPLVVQLGESEEELSETGPYYAYGVFASEAAGRAADPEFVRELARFANELAQSGDPLLRDLLITTIFEELAVDPELAARLKNFLGLKARELLDAVEQDWFGRDPSSSA
jgi:hypothetical protein